MRLLFDRNWYEPVSSEGQFEKDFEDVIQSRANSLFPDYHVVPFKIRVESEEGRKIPDLALIDRKYRYWWVVEVEMAHHSLYGHVLPQVEVLTRGRYTQHHCNYLTNKYNVLDPSALSDMVKGLQPRILVIVNQNVPDWVEPIHRLDGLVTVVEVFRSNRNQHILRLNGDYPTAIDANFVTACRLDDAMSRLLQIHSPAGLGIANGQSISIKYNDGLTTWSRLDTLEDVWLIPQGRNPLSPSRDYVILKDSSGQMSFKSR